ncbi:MAG: hypothetical protein BGO01_10525 [Armatimonadetes bacterium 55-13]|nr:protein-glutamate O-methyltransferase CheR [Armatimonadota bacterium]OJU62832.1 MAG: hypothetical protein BGO01_10525 [Armatimonadetes bacterium 55-13]
MDSIELSSTDFGNIRKLIYRLTGISLSDSKHQLVKSRLRRRLRALDISSYNDYYGYVVQLPPDHEEIISLINAVTTNKTDFFRESHHFDFMVKQIVPEFMAKSQHDLKIWHAGCSTGEEPYTMAIALREHFSTSELCFMQLASDIDTEVLAHAERGVYDAERVEGMSKEMLQRWFLRGKGNSEGKYRIRPELQENMRFRRINLTKRPWPLRAETQFDVILCRNVLIYFDRETQKQVIQGFYDRLVPGGYLMLGHSESVQGKQDVFRSVGKTIYKANAGATYRLAA